MNPFGTAGNGAASGISLDAALVGCILGTAVGDALGLPYEALSRRRQRKLFRDITRHQFLFGRGMTSDDTEHTCFVAGALIASGGDPDRFSRIFAWKLRLLAARPCRAATFWPALGVRNTVFLATLLVHGVRRMLPPY